MSKKGCFSLFIILILLICGGFYYRYQIQKALRPPQGGQQDQPPMVMVLKPQVQDVENAFEFTGNTAAVEQVEIKARVEGFLQGIHFSDGAEVEAGDLLFTIEPELYQARCEQAEAQLQAAQADLERTQLDLERAELAIQTNAISRQDLTTKKSLRDQAQANLLAAQADLKTAQLNLSYTRMVSPIAGRVSRRFVDVGNLVGAGEQTTLASIVKLQPIYVYFNISEDILQRYFLLERPENRSSAKHPFSVTLADNAEFNSQGFLDYIDNQVDSMTGTIAVRGQLPNAEKTLLPGMFVRVSVPVGTSKDAVLIEQRALQSDLRGKYVLTVDEKNIVQAQPVTLGQVVGKLVVVESGLDADQTYIVSGFHFARPGAPVSPVPEGQMPPSGPGAPDASAQGPPSSAQ